MYLNVRYHVVAWTYKTVRPGCLPPWGECPWRVYRHKRHWMMVPSSASWRVIQCLLACHPIPIGFLLNKHKGRKPLWLSACCLWAGGDSAPLRHGRVPQAGGSYVWRMAGSTVTSCHLRHLLRHRQRILLSTMLMLRLTSWPTIQPVRMPGRRCG